MTEHNQETPRHGRWRRRLLKWLGGLTLAPAIVTVRAMWPVAWPIGPDTTYITEPLDGQGYINYEVAVNERFAEGVKPEENAALLLAKAAGPKPEGWRLRPRFYKLLGAPEPPDEGDYFTDFRDHLSDTVGQEMSGPMPSVADPTWAEAYLRRSEAAGRRTWAAADVPLVAAWLRVNAEPLKHAVAASRRPKYFHPLVSPWPPEFRGTLIESLLPFAQRGRDAAEALAIRAGLRAAEGRLDDAWGDIVACLRLGRLVGSGAAMIENVIGVAAHEAGCRAATTSTGWSVGCWSAATSRPACVRSTPGGIAWLPSPRCRGPRETPPSRR